MQIFDLSEEKNLTAALQCKVFSPASERCVRRARGRVQPILLLQKEPEGQFSIHTSAFLLFQKYGCLLHPKEPSKKISATL